MKWEKTLLIDGDESHGDVERTIPLRSLISLLSINNQLIQQLV